LEEHKSVIIEKNELVNDGTDYFKKCNDIETIEHNSIKRNDNKNESITNVNNIVIVDSDNTDSKESINMIENYMS
jgi:hypothetical protein